MKKSVSNIHPRVIERLSNHFPEVDMKRVRVYQGVNMRLPEFIRRIWGATAITFGNRIFLSPNAPDQPSQEGTLLMAHELVHVRQYKENGFLRMILSYCYHYTRLLAKGSGFRGAYFRIPYEQEAFRFERDMARLLSNPKEGKSFS